MSAINDPLGQTHSSASSDHYSRLNFVLFCEIVKSGDGRTTRAELVITTGGDCESASWIKSDPYMDITFQLIWQEKKDIIYYTSWIRN